MNDYFCEVKGESKGLFKSEKWYFQMVKAKDHYEAYEQLQQQYTTISEWKIKEIKTNKIWTNDTQDMLKMDGFEDCISGIVERFNHPPIVCYDKEKVLIKLTTQGLEPEEAMEYFEFNQLGAWVGETTPCFITHTNNE